MTNNKKVHVSIVLDRSGSMSSCIDDAIGGVNAYLDALIASDQKLGTETTVTLVQFDDQYEVICNALPVTQVEKRNRENYLPRGMTRYLDALGMTIVSTGEALAAMPEHDRPGHVLVYIQTDGHENNSQEYTATKVSKMVEHQTKKYGWEFVGIVASDSGEALAKNLGLQNVAKYTATSRGTAHMYRTVANSTSNWMATKLEGTYEAGTLFKGSLELPEEEKNEDENKPRGNVSH